MTTLTQFLLDRIEEDEQVARGAGGHPAVDDGIGLGMTHDGLMVTEARILAECAAKRRVVELHSTRLTIAGPDGNAHRCRACSGQVSPCRTLRAMAEVYGEHDDYRSEWPGEEAR